MGALRNSLASLWILQKSAARPKRSPQRSELVAYQRRSKGLHSLKDSAASNGERALSTRYVLNAIYRTMARDRRRHFVLVLVLMVLGAFAELLTIGAVVPFLAIIAAPDSIRSIPFLGDLLAPFESDALMVMTVLLAVLAVAAGAIRLALSWFSQKFVFRLGHDVGVRIFARMLRQPYGYYVQRNTSEVLAGIEKIQNVIFAVLLPLIQAVVALVMATFIIALLLAIDPTVAIVSALALAAVYLSVSMISRRLLRHNSTIIAAMQTERIKQIQEGLGGIRDILLDQSQSVFEESFRRLDDALRHAQTVNVFVGSAPRFAVESAGIVLIAFLALSMSEQAGGLIAVLPTLGALALGAQRLLPLLQLIYVGWSQYVGSFSLLADVVELIDAPVVSSKPRVDGQKVIPFRDEIRFAGVSFVYPGSETCALTDIRFTIRRGEKLGLVGQTGGGKSTLLDILMGLLDPTTGSVLVDGRPIDDATRTNWQAQIAHVPQSIYLSDASIRSNIAFGEPPERVDEERVRSAARRAQIADVIEQMPAGYDTIVGERGVRLSGGQRQRLGIARALYKSAGVLILDEATSALDDQTERNVVDAIMESGDITMMIIAHRVSTLARCDRVLEINNGQIMRVGSYADMIGWRGAAA